MSEMNAPSVVVFTILIGLAALSFIMSVMGTLGAFGS